MIVLSSQRPKKFEKPTRDLLVKYLGVHCLYASDIPHERSCALGPGQETAGLTTSPDTLFPKGLRWPHHGWLCRCCLLTNLTSGRFVSLSFNCWFHLWGTGGLMHQTHLPCLHETARFFPQNFPLTFHIYSVLPRIQSFKLLFTIFHGDF